MSATQSPAEHELAEIIVSALNLEGVAPAQIDPEAPLFKTGLGLDSIDALELALEISKRYGFSCAPMTRTTSESSARCARSPGTSRSIALPERQTFTKTDSATRKFRS